MKEEASEQVLTRTHRCTWLYTLWEKNPTPGSHSQHMEHAGICCAGLIVSVSHTRSS